MPSQVDNGKAFEFAVANTYFQYLSDLGLTVTLQDDPHLNTVKSKYNLFSSIEKARFDSAAKSTIETLIKLEPGLVTQRGSDDFLNIKIAGDAAGISGDVRDIIFTRNKSPFWEIGFSAKNNHDAVKHSRLSPTINFGSEWLGLSCSPQYFEAINIVFNDIKNHIEANPTATWSSYKEICETNVYVPILEAFRTELLSLSAQNASVPEQLLRYLIGKHPFYKIVKDDRNNCVEVKAFNIEGKLGKRVGGVRPQHSTERIYLPSEIVNFRFKPGLESTLLMILDQGWQISFRIHNASSKLEASLKFDINLIGNPPIIFTQHLFIDL